MKHRVDAFFHILVAYYLVYATFSHANHLLQAAFVIGAWAALDNARNAIRRAARDERDGGGK